MTSHSSRGEGLDGNILESGKPYGQPGGTATGRGDPGDRTTHRSGDTVYLQGLRVGQVVHDDLIRILTGEDRMN